jgi:hypothetical protein
MDGLRIFYATEFIDGSDLSIMIETEVTTQYNISVKSIKCFGEWLSL